MTRASSAMPQAIEGLVLRLRDVGESDRFVEVLSPTNGRMCLKAPRARVSRRRFGGTLDLFASLRMQVQQGRSMPYLLAVDVLNLRLALRDDLQRFSTAARLCAATYALAPQLQPAPELFHTLSAALDAVACDDFASWAAGYRALLQHSGLLPDMTVCGQCGARNQTMSARVPLDAALCMRCAPKTAPLPNATCEVLCGQPCASMVVAQRVEAWVLELIAAHVGHPLRAGEAVF